VTITGANAAAGAWARGRQQHHVVGAERNQHQRCPKPNLIYAGHTTIITNLGAGRLDLQRKQRDPNSGLLAIDAGSSIFSTGTTINVNASAANFSTGVEAANGGTIDLTNNAITTTATFSSGIRVDGNGTVIGRDFSRDDLRRGRRLARQLSPRHDRPDQYYGASQRPGHRRLVALNFSASSVNNVSLSGAV